jgi:hypothetical protein
MSQKEHDATKEMLEAGRNFLISDIPEGQTLGEAMDDFIDRVHKLKKHHRLYFIENPSD